MRGNRRTDTRPELRLRSALHKMGHRFRKDAVIEEEGVRVRADLVFRRARVAVFVDGCFWHGCAEHGRMPKSNVSYWTKKIARNVARDRLVNAELTCAGWRVLRFWEHVEPREAAERVSAELRS